jgi:hypothetical protein
MADGAEGSAAAVSEVTGDCQSRRVRYAVALENDEAYWCQRRYSATIESVAKRLKITGLEVPK